MGLVRDVWTDHVCLSGEVGIVHAELMLITRRTMYQTVYYEPSSRVAEKMVHKAIIWMLDETDIIDDKYFTDPSYYVKLDDYEVFSMMKESQGFAEEVLSRIKSKRLFNIFYSEPIRHLENLSELISRHDYEGIQKLQRELLETWHVDPRRVIFDRIEPSSFEKESVFVEINQNISPIEEVSNIVSSLVKTRSSDMKYGVYIDKQATGLSEDKVEKDVEEIFGGR